MLEYLSVFNSQERSRHGLQKKVCIGKCDREDSERYACESLSNYWIVDAVRSMTDVSHTLTRIKKRRRKRRRRRRRKNIS